MIEDNKIWKDNQSLGSLPATSTGSKLKKLTLGPFYPYSEGEIDREKRNLPCFQNIVVDSNGTFYW